MPDKAKIMQNCVGIAKSAMDKVKTTPCGGPQKESFHDFLGFVEAVINNGSDCWKTFVESVCEMMVDSVQDLRYLLPCKLLGTLCDQVEIILSDVNKHASLINLLNVPENSKTEVKSQFLLKFVLYFAEQILSFITDSIKVSSQSERNDVITLDDEERQVVYYIAGSIMRGYKRIAFRFKKSQKWAAIWQNIEKYVLTDQPVRDSN